MDEQELLGTLSEVARQERAPTVEVSARVLERIRTAEPAENWPMAVMTGIAAAAAYAVFSLASEAWSAWQDPVTGLMVSMSMVLE